MHPGITDIVGDLDPVELNVTLPWDIDRTWTNRQLFIIHLLFINIYIYIFTFILMWKQEFESSWYTEI